jgi:hypothetical protein
MLLELDLLRYQNQLDIEYTGNKKYIFGLIRKKYLILTPEEIVRQILLLYLIEEKGFPVNKISVEKEIKLNGLKKRYDILVFDKELNPIFLVECKSAKIPLSQNTFEQIGRYNITLKVPYLLICNGPHAYCAQINQERESFDFLNQCPSYQEIINP